jgi:hypothetical protein
MRLINALSFQTLIHKFLKASLNLQSFLLKYIVLFWFSFFYMYAWHSGRVLQNEIDLEKDIYTADKKALN